MITVADIYDFIESQDIYCDDEPEPVRLDWLEQAERREMETEQEYERRVERDGYLVGTVLA